MRRVVAAEHLERPVDHPLENGLAISGGANRRVHLETGVEGGPGGHRPILPAPDRSAVAAPELVAPRDGYVCESEVMWARLARDRQSTPLRLPNEGHARG